MIHSNITVLTEDKTQLGIIIFFLDITKQDNSALYEALETIGAYKDYIYYTTHPHEQQGQIILANNGQVFYNVASIEAYVDAVTKNNLQNQLGKIYDEALLIIKKHASNSEQNVCYVAKDNAYNEEEEELNQDFIDAVPELIHRSGSEYETVYPLMITGTEYEPHLMAIDESGNETMIDIFDLDQSNTCAIADWLEGKN